MDSALVIVAICVVVLLSYLFDVSSKLTKIPSVILLIALGFIISLVSKELAIPTLDLSSVLPILGTIGLILIVLDESFELQLGKDRIPIIKKSLIVAVFPMLILCALLAMAFCFFRDANWHVAVVNAIPLAIISSAIAIPSVHHLRRNLKEFVVYESSLSDIIGVVIFNFFALNAVFDAGTMLVFVLQILLMLLISFVASILLSWLLYKIDHHIKFVPIIVLIILIYEVSKIYHLPALIFILIFGILIGNLDLLRNKKINQLVHPEVLDQEIINFRQVVTEGTFLIRTLFFVVFGYLIHLPDLLNFQTLIWSLIIVAGVFSVRAVQLRAIGLPLFPLLFVAPRGLITILLFLSIPVSMEMPLVNKSLIIQVIIITVLIMMIGMLFHKEEELAEEEPLDEVPPAEPVLVIDESL
jgi:Kef-type K+ transport system membrane component KefB